MLRKIYILFGLFVLLGYGFFALNGYELTPSRRQFVPQGVRGQVGGAGSVWYRGYHGGK